MNAQKIRRYSFVTALVISGCVSASASVVAYTDQPTWLAATSGVNNIDFEAQATHGTITDYGGSSGTLTIGSVSFQGFDFQFTGADLKVNNDILPNWGTGAVLVGPGHAGSFSRIAVTLGPGVFAVGSDIFDLNGGATSEAGTVNVVLSTGDSFVVNTVAGFSSYAFEGFVSTTPITSVTFFPLTPGADNVAIDNFSTGGQGVSSAPEGATLILCGVGLLLMGCRFRRNPNSETATA